MRSAKLHRARLVRARTTPDATLREALSRLDAAGTGALVVAEPDGTLVGLLTDGDFRRAVLGGVPLDRPCGALARRDPVVAREGIAPAAALRLMDRVRDYPIHHLPLVDGAGRVVGLLLRSDLTADAGLPLPEAVIMAGGFGRRLRPLTDGTPKPMLPLGGRPILERTIGQLREAGIGRVNITTHYLAERITEYFGDGRDFGVEVRYVREDVPLGTAGALALIDDWREPLLVINGDVVTDLPFRELVAFHRDQRALATVGVRNHELQVPYGVVRSDGTRVRALAEKPRLDFLVSAGVYLLEPAARAYIPPDRPFDMPDLIGALLADGREVACFPILEYWVDIGQPGDYARAQAELHEVHPS